MRVDTLLRDLLEATAAKTAASRRIDRLRDVLDTEARRRLAAEGAAPSWKAPKLGSVRLDPKPAKAYVSDPDAFANYVAQRFPSEVTARIELDATQLEAALEALSFAGLDVRRSAVEVRPTFTEALLANADVLYDDSDPANVVKAVGRPNEHTGELELVDGTDVLPPSASLVVTLDRDRKRAELERVDLELEDELADPAPLAEQIDAPGVVTFRPDVAADEAHAADVGARLIASATAAGEAASDADYADSRVVSAQQDAAAGYAERFPTARAGDAAREARTPAGVVARPAEDADAAHLGDPYTPAVRAVPASPAPTPTEARTEAELATGVDADTISLGTPDPAAVARVNAAAGAPVEPVPGVVDELVKLSSDDLKRAARNARVPLNGTKVLLAGRLARAGLTAADVIALRPA